MSIGEKTMITIEELMTPNPLTLSQYSSLADARKLMNEKQIRHVPVVNEDKELIGLVTQRTVLTHGVSSQTFASEKELAKIEAGVLLSDIMTKNLTTATSNWGIRKAAQIIHKTKFGCLPVVDDENKLVGIITDHDFVATTIHLLEMMEQSEPLEDDEF